MPVKTPDKSNTQNVKVAGRSSGGGKPTIGRLWFGRLHTIRLGTGPGVKQIHPRAVRSVVVGCPVAAAVTAAVPASETIDSAGRAASLGLVGDFTWSHAAATVGNDQHRERPVRLIYLTFFDCRLYTTSGSWPRWSCHPPFFLHLTQTPFCLSNASRFILAENARMFRCRSFPSSTYG